MLLKSQSCQVFLKEIVKDLDKQITVSKYRFICVNLTLQAQGPDNFRNLVCQLRWNICSFDEVLIVLSFPIFPIVLTVNK